MDKCFQKNHTFVHRNLKIKGENLKERKDLFIIQYYVMLSNLDGHIWFAKHNIMKHFK